jgi:hypothetical protein
MTRMAALVLLLVVAAAPVLVAANVPDPTWIGGLYDAGDADEILALVWDETPAVVAATLSLDTRPAARFEVVPLPAVAATPSSPSPSSRAPPRS